MTILALIGAVCAIGFALRSLSHATDEVVQRATPPFATDDEQPDIEPVRKPPMAVPEVLENSDPRIGPDDQIIGVNVNGTFRAYAVSAFSDIGLHVVNDLIGDRPVTVSFCPRTGCARVYTGPVGKRLSVAVGGWLNRAGSEQMLLRVNRTLFQQTNGESVSGGEGLPYRALDFELTTWREWQQKHPTTELYSGGARVSY